MTEYKQENWSVGSVAKRLSKLSEEGWEFVCFIGTQFNYFDDLHIHILVARTQVPATGDA